MLPYWLLFAIYASGTFASRRGAFEGRQLTPMFLLVGLATALMIGLRWQVGGDWRPYIDLFHRIQLLEFSQAIFLSDPGYSFLNWIVAWLGADFWLVNLIGGVIFSFGLGLFARGQPNPWLTALVAVPYLVIVVAMGYTRQGIAIGLVMVALSDQYRTSTLRFIVFVILAASFHKSAIIVVPLLALTQTRYRIVSFAILMMTAAVVYYLLVSDNTDELLQNYVDAEYNSSGAFIRIFMNIPPALIYLIYQTKFMLSDDTRKLWRNFALASIIALILLLTTPSSTAIDRVSLYLIPLQMLVLGRLPYVVRGKRDSNILLLIILAYSAAIQFVWLNYADHREAWLPYHFYAPGFGKV